MNVWEIIIKIGKVLLDSVWNILLFTAWNLFFIVYLSLVFLQSCIIKIIIFMIQLLIHNPFIIKGFVVFCLLLGDFMAESIMELSMSDYMLWVDQLSILHDYIEAISKIDLKDYLEMLKKTKESWK